jgi:hypothetical protein
MYVLLTFPRWIDAQAGIARKLMRIGTRLGVQRIVDRLCLTAHSFHCSIRLFSRHTFRLFTSAFHCLKEDSCFSLGSCDEFTMGWFSVGIHAWAKDILMHSSLAHVAKREKELGWTNKQILLYIAFTSLLPI